MTNLERLEQLANERRDLVTQLNYYVVLRGLSETAQRLTFFLSVLIGVWRLFNHHNGALTPVAGILFSLFLIEILCSKIYVDKILEFRTQIAQVERDIRRLPNG